MKKLLSVMFIAALTLTACGSNDTAEENVGGKINVYTRDAASGTRDAFESIVGFEDELTKEAIEVSGNGDMATKVGGDVSGIGYVSLTTDFEANGLKPLKYEGVEADEAHVLDGTYVLQRPFSYVTRAAGDFGSAELEQLTAAFIDYMVNSVEGREVVAGAHGIVDIDAGTPWDELKVNHPIVDRDNSDLTLITVGSTSVTKALQASLESFQGLAGNFNFEMQHTGSSDGFKRTLGSEKDGANQGHIGFASRPFKSEETVDLGMETGVFALDAVVAVVNKENSAIDNITKDTLASIFKGEITDWSEVK